MTDHALFVASIILFGVVAIGLPLVLRLIRGGKEDDGFQAAGPERAIDDDIAEAIATPTPDDRAVLIRQRTEAMAIPILPGFEDAEETETYGNPPKDAA